MMKKTKPGEKLSMIFGRIFSKLPLTPNIYTLLALSSSFLGLYFVLTSSFFLAFLSFSLSFLLDAVDGAVARAKRLMSKKGAYIDGVSDRVVETLFLISMMFLGLPNVSPTINFWILINLAFGTYMTSFSKAYADHRGVISKDLVESMPGILERGERVILYLAAFAVYHYNPVYSSILLVFTAILSVITSLQRVLFALSHKDRERKRSSMLKQIVVIRSDLRMGKGKLAAQVAHASLQAFLATPHHLRNEWLESGQKKVVLKAEREELLKAYRKAKRRGMNPVLIHDAGLTQLKKGELTAMGVGPYEERLLDEIFGGFKLA